MDEPKKLKEKFDDIFDAAKYNKCSDSITKIRKGKMEGEYCLVKNSNFKCSHLVCCKKIFDFKRQCTMLIETKLLFLSLN